MAFWKKDPAKEAEKKLAKIEKRKAKADIVNREIKKLNNELTAIMHKGDLKNPRLRFIKNRLKILTRQTGA